MKQEEAVAAITKSLIADERVLAIFLKGSMGRGEYDEYSDVDLYCMVEEEQQEFFLLDRLKHLAAYRPIKFYDDFFIIAPQMITVYDDLLHVDLFTVTEKNFIEKDYFKVVYDPTGILKKFEATQNLRLSNKEFDDCTYDMAWFLFQYYKADRRKNDIWAVEMLHQVLNNFAKVLLHHYQPERAQLGLKALHSHLLKEQLVSMKDIFNCNTPKCHARAVKFMIKDLQKEMIWIDSMLEKDSQSGRFLNMMINILD
ncbi:nucleotidyltransferase domain-containing protein [Robertmurraya massiliosenegalensis]|uniref:nucleotidyltransferase domain-containing protein n=1 Tax=Robertmurraya massiliosenegalensis TaxID=1287657 RepID=UPI00030991D3|nr:nucleotidyltransferase domain-containing protein [Robertmurraya massiliosenegalensis]